MERPLEFTDHWIRVREESEYRQEEEPHYRLVEREPPSMRVPPADARASDGVQLSCRPP